MITTVENYIGVMSGSSLDGLDMAMISLTLDPVGEITSWRLERNETALFDQELKERLRAFYDLQAVEYFKLESDFSRWVAEKVLAFANMGVVKAIGFHGHTLTHHPEEYFSVQMGNGGIIAAISNIDTITDFRIQDILKGGSGAPIVPTVEKALFSGYDYYLNLGGIANMTLILQNQAYDICPCNQLLNHLAKKVGKDYDGEGEMARKGTIQKEIIERLNQLPYFHTLPPKSIDNYWVKTDVLPLFEELNVEDGLATAVEFMVDKISDATSSSGKMLITGGGAHNDFLVERLKEKIESKNIAVILPDENLIDGKEAVLMAYMAYARIHHKVNIHHDFTGATNDTVAGAHYKSR